MPWADRRRHEGPFYRHRIVWPRPRQADLRTAIVLCAKCYAREHGLAVCTDCGKAHPPGYSRCWSCWLRTGPYPCSITGCENRVYLEKGVCRECYRAIAPRQRHRPFRDFEAEAEEDRLRRVELADKLADRPEPAEAPGPDPWIGPPPIPVSDPDLDALVVL